MPSEATNKATRRQWRELGFFYSRDDSTKVWELRGSKTGLLRFRDELLAYSADPRYKVKAEHEHYGPYAYLKVMTWPETSIDQRTIRGPLGELARLAGIIETKLADAEPNSVIRIREEFAKDSPYSIVLSIQEDGFDPASADPRLPPI